MSLCSRRTVVLMPLALVACGFQPAYGPEGDAGVLQNSVEVIEPGNVDAYLMTRRLEERLGRATVPSYRLTLNVTTRRDSLAVNAQNNINRFNLVGTATYSLVDQATGQVVTSGTVDNFAGSSASGTTVATLAAERDARQRLMVMLADQIVVRLISADIA